MHGMCKCPLILLRVKRNKTSVREGVEGYDVCVCLHMCAQSANWPVQLSDHAELVQAFRSPPWTFWQWLSAEEVGSITHAAASGRSLSLATPLWVLLSIITRMYSFSVSTLASLFWKVYMYKILESMLAFKSIRSKTKLWTDTYGVVPKELLTILGFLMQRRV